VSGKYIVPVVSSRRETITSGGCEFAVTRLDNVNLEFYNKVKVIDDEKKVINLIMAINRWYDKYRYGMDTVKRVLKAIELFEHVIVKVYWTYKYLVPLVIQTIGAYERCNFAWLIAPRAKRRGDSNE